MTPKVKEIFTDCSFTLAPVFFFKSDDYCKADDRRVKEVFQEYDATGTGFLLIENFLEFYTIACRKKSNIVWNNLHAHHYRNDLKKYSEIEESPVDLKTLPRFLLSTQETTYSILFTILEKYEKNSRESGLIWSLLNRLPTSPFILEKVKKMENFDELLTCPNKYQLLYVLSVIESLLEDKIEDMDENETGSAEWRFNFIYSGGFNKVIAILKDLLSIGFFELDNIEKSIFCLILRITKNYVVAAVSSEYPATQIINKCVAMSQFSLEVVKEALREDFQPYEPDKVVDGTPKIEESATILKKKASFVRTKLENTKEFSSLVDMLRGDLGKKILENVGDYSIYLGIVHNILLNDVESDERILVECCLVISGSLLLKHKNEIADIEKMPKFKTEFAQFIEFGLLHLGSQNIRRHFSHFFFILAKETDMTSNLLESLDCILDKIHESQFRENIQFFDLYISLIEEHFKKTQSSSGVHDFSYFSSLFEKSMTKILNHESNEKRSSVIFDKILVGLLSICEKLATLLPPEKLHFSDLAQKIFSSCLFSESGKSEFEIKCKTSNSRRLAYNLIEKLCEKSPENLFSIIKGGVKPVLESAPMPSTWGFTPANDVKSFYGYVGIRNLACICYMNAMLQQFFLCPLFRYGILMASDEQECNMVEFDNNQVDDNVFHQFQFLFSFLELSDRQDYNPVNFCFSFKDYSGEPVNVRVQQDTQEFLNMLFDKLDNVLKVTPFCHLLDGVYGGKTCNQIICSQCKTISEREETFYNLTLDVIGHKCLDDSLKKLIEGEIISDYNCEKCQKKVEIEKRTVLSELPNVLIIHLKRIVFNFDSLMNEKINSRLEFGQELDMSSYCKKNAEGQVIESCPNYTLKGVLVHTGAADYGHYFSYIKVREGKWLEFNDSYVRDFDVKKLESECFGGNSDSYDDVWGFKDSSKNAYILVYEKEKKKPFKIDLSKGSEKEKKRIIEEVGLVPNEAGDILLNFDTIPTYVSPKCRDKVAQDNHQFMMERHLFSSEFFSFSKNLISLISTKTGQESSKETVKEMVCMIDKLVFGLLAHAYDNGVIYEITQKLIDYLAIVPEYSVEYLDDLMFNKRFEFSSYLLSCTDKTVRISAERILLTTVSLAINHFKIDFDSIEDDSPGYTVKKALDKLFAYLDFEVPKNWIKFCSYFEFWRNFALLGAIHTKYLIDKGVISHFIDLFLEGRSPLGYYVDKKYSFGNKYATPTFDPLLQCVEVVTRRVLLQNAEKSPYGIAGSPLYECTETDLSCLLSSDFYEKALRDGFDSAAISILISRLSFENPDFTLTIVGMLLKEFNKCTYDTTRQYLDVFYSLLLIDDSLTNRRIGMILGFPTPKRKFEGYALDGTVQSQTVNYDSTIKAESEKSILNALINARVKWENLTLVIMHKLLLMCLNSDKILNYILNIPSPAPCIGCYLDWFSDYISKLMKDYTKQYYSSFSNFNREAYYNECLKLITTLQEKGDISGKRVSLILGKTISSEILADQNYLVINDKNVVTFFSKEVTLYYSTLDKIPKEHLDSNGNIIINNIAPESNIANLLYKSRKYSEEFGNTNDVNLKPIVYDEEEEIEDKNKPWLDFTKKQENKAEKADLPVVNIEMNSGALLREYFVENNSLEDYHLEVDIKAQKETKILLPDSVAIALKAKQTELLFVLQRDNVEEEWPEFSVVFRYYSYNNHTEKEDENFEIDGYMPQQRDRKENLLPVIVMNNQSSSEEKKECQACTFLNTPRSSVCIVCNSDLAD